MEIICGESEHGVIFWNNNAFFLIITTEEAGGNGGASCVSSALKPVSASPIEDAWPNANLGVPGATSSEVKLIGWCNPVLKPAPRFRQLIREAQTGGQQPRGGGQSLLSVLAGVQSILAIPALVGPQAFLPSRHSLCWASPWLGNDNAV